MFFGFLMKTYSSSLVNDFLMTLIDNVTWLFMGVKEERLLFTLSALTWLTNKGESATRLSGFNPNKAQRSKMTSKTSLTDVLRPGQVVDLDWAIGSAAQKRTGRYWALPETPFCFLLFFFCHLFRLLFGPRLSGKSPNLKAFSSMNTVVVAFKLQLLIVESMVI